MPLKKSPAGKADGDWQREEVTPSETPQGRSLIEWCLSTDLNGVSEGMNNNMENVPGRRNSHRRSPEVAGSMLVWQQQGDQCGWSEGEGTGASAKRGSFRAVFLGTSLIYNLDLSPEWD